MEERSVTHSTFVIERNYPVPPERVFAAFADPVRKQRWMGGEGREALEYEQNFRVGGTERAHSRFKEGTPFPGTTLTSLTTYQDIVPNQRIVMAYTMTLGEHRFSASLATVELRPTDTGTDLIFTEQGAYFENSDGPKMRQDGWTKLLQRLAGEVSA